MLVCLLIRCTSFNKDIDITIITLTQLNITYLLVWNYPARSYLFEKMIHAYGKNRMLNLTMAVIMCVSKSNQLFSIKIF